MLLFRPTEGDPDGPMLPLSDGTIPLAATKLLRCGPIAKEAPPHPAGGAFLILLVWTPSLVGVKTKNAAG